jgi:dihydroorotate dehydrogenase (NAD+) catalytic subunit
MLNAVGLQNPGVRHVIDHELPELATFFHKPVMANISGFSLEEYVEVADIWTHSRRWAGWK